MSSLGAFEQESCAQAATCDSFLAATGSTVVGTPESRPLSRLA